MSVEEYLHARAGKWSPETVDRYTRILTRLETNIEIGPMSADDLRRWLGQQPWGSSMRYLAVSAIRGYLRWQFGQHTALTIIERRVPSPPQRALKPAEISRLIEHFDTSTTKGLRDLAICCLMLDTGLRVSEVCRLELRYMDLEAGTLQVIIKGRQWGFAMYSTSTRRFIQNWLANRPGDQPWVFVSLGGIKRGCQLTRSGLQKIILRWGLSAGIGSISPHDLRRTFAVQATRLGAPSRLVQLAGRWSSIEMVELYTRTLEVSDFERYFPVTGLGY